jgi:hypothetical protein
MTSCLAIVGKLYEATVANGASRSAYLGQLIGSTDSIAGLTDDDMRNQSSLYADLFSESCESVVHRLLQNVLDAMRGKPYVECDDLFNAALILQMLVATAMWRYGCSVDQQLEQFARGFDRLDVESERARLFLLAQAEKA